MSLVCPVNVSSIEKFKLLAQSIRLYGQNFCEFIFTVPNHNSPVCDVIRAEMAIFADRVTLIDQYTLFGERKWPTKYDVVLVSEIIESEHYLVVTPSCVLTRPTHSGEKGGYGVIGWYKTSVVKSYIPNAESKEFPPLDVMYRSGARHKLVHAVRKCSDTMNNLDDATNPIIYISSSLELPITMKRSILHKHLQLAPNPLMVSCLMVTKNRLRQVKNAVECYIKQTYTNRELVVVCDDDRQTQQYIESLRRPDIRFIDVEPSPDLTLGSLRNTAIQHAHGYYITQWDDDDWYNPSRIMTQVMLLEEANADITLLGQWLAVWPKQKMYTVSFHRREGWEGSMLMVKDKAVEYEEMKRAEDTKFISSLRKEKVKFLITKDRQYSLLYVYNVHDNNTWPEDHFSSLFSGGSDISSLSREENSVTGPLWAEKLAEAVQQDYEGYEPTNHDYSVGELIFYGIAFLFVSFLVLVFVNLFFGQRNPVHDNENNPSLVS